MNLSLGSGLIVLRWPMKT